MAEISVSPASSLVRSAAATGVPVSESIFPSTRRGCGRTTSANPSCSAYSATRPLVDRSLQKALTFPRCSSSSAVRGGGKCFLAEIKEDRQCSVLLPYLVG